jgi:hypothetical protein
VVGAVHTAPESHVSGFMQGSYFCSATLTSRIDGRKGDTIIYLCSKEKLEFVF